MADEKNANDDDFKIDAPLDYIEDELNGEGDDNSSEINDLDTFFEDLSNLDNEGSDTPQDFPDVAVPPPVIPDSPEKEPIPRKNTPKKPKSKLRGKSFKPSARMLLGAISLFAVGVLAFFLFPIAQDILTGLGNAEEEEVLPVFAEPVPIEPPSPIFVEPEEREARSIKPIPGKSSRIGPFHADLDGRWSVRLASCSFGGCVENIRARIENLGYVESDLTIQRTRVKSRFLNVFIENYFEETDAKKIVKKINRRNELGLQARTVQNKRKQIRIFLTKIPDEPSGTAIDSLNKIKGHMGELFNKYYSELDLSVNHNVETKNLKVTRISVGPFESHSTAKEALADIKTDSFFKDSFVFKAAR